MKPLIRSISQYESAGLFLDEAKDVGSGLSWNDHVQIPVGAQCMYEFGKKSTCIKAQHPVGLLAFDICEHRRRLAEPCFSRPKSLLA